MPNILEMIGVPEQIGEVGLELEIEGDNLPQEIKHHWRVEGDGSLRGGLEYVMKQPCLRQNVPAQVEYLFTNLRHSTLKQSNRTSIHVHVNVQQMTPGQVFNFITLYLALEDALVKWCGADREGNLFCLRAKDAEYLLDLLEQVARSGKMSLLKTDKIRYASLNCNALYKYGSLEFRAMRFTSDQATICAWVDMLLRIKDAAMEYEHPGEIVDGYSEGGENYFCSHILGPHFEEVCCYEGWEAEVYGGIRRVQAIAYAYQASAQAAPAPREEEGEEREGQGLGDMLRDIEKNEARIARMKRIEARKVEMGGGKKKARMEGGLRMAPMEWANIPAPVPDAD